MDAAIENAHVWWNVGCAVIASAGSIIAYYTKTHYHNIDKKLEDNEGDIKILVQKIHELGLVQARGESLSAAISELKAEVKELRNAVGKLGRDIGARRRGDSESP